ncbi:MAG: hypothetical protein ACUVUQ_07100 [Thermodesulfovibrionales bacterium]
MYSHAPEIDGIVYITNYHVKMGKIANVRIKSFKDYDLFGECVLFNSAHILSLCASPPVRVLAG